MQRKTSLAKLVLDRSESKEFADPSHFYSVIQSMANTLEFYEDEPLDAFGTVRRTFYLQFSETDPPVLHRLGGPAVFVLTPEGRVRDREWWVAGDRVDWIINLDPELSQGVPTLQHAVEGNHMNLVQWLIDTQGADLNAIEITRAVAASPCLEWVLERITRELTQQEIRTILRTTQSMDVLVRRGWMPTSSSIFEALTYNQVDLARAMIEYSRTPLINLPEEVDYVRGIVPYIQRNIPVSMEEDPGEHVAEAFRYGNAAYAEYVITANDIAVDQETITMAIQTVGDVSFLRMLICLMSEEEIEEELEWEDVFTVAVANNELPVIRYLVEELNLDLSYARVALMDAVHDGLYPIAQYLVEMGIEITSTMIENAIDGGHLMIVQMLVDASNPWMLVRELPRLREHARLRARETNNTAILDYLEKL